MPLFLFHFQANQLLNTDHTFKLVFIFQPFLRLVAEMLPSSASSPSFLSVSQSPALAPFFHLPFRGQESPGLCLLFFMVYTGLGNCTEIQNFQRSVRHQKLPSIQLQHLPLSGAHTQIFGCLLELPMRMF